MMVQCLLRGQDGSSYMVSWIDHNLAKEGAHVELLEGSCVLGVYEIVCIYRDVLVSDEWIKKKQKADRKGMPSIQKAERNFSS